MHLGCGIQLDGVREAFNFGGGPRLRRHKRHAIGAKPCGASAHARDHVIKVIFCHSSLARRNGVVAPRGARAAIAQAAARRDRLPPHGTYSVRRGL
jgi:hypothetical protein